MTAAITASIRSRPVSRPITAPTMAQRIPYRRASIVRGLITRHNKKAIAVVATIMARREYCGFAIFCTTAPTTFSVDSFGHALLFSGTRRFRRSRLPQRPLDECGQCLRSRLTYSSKHRRFSVATRASRCRRPHTTRPFPSQLPKRRQHTAQSPATQRAVSTTRYLNLVRFLGANNRAVGRSIFS